MNTTETTSPFWRQGDIYFVKLDQSPDFDDAKPVKTGVIARGEETGHMHRVSNTSLADGATPPVSALELKTLSRYPYSSDKRCTSASDE